VANLEIKIYPDKILRKKASPVSRIGDDEVAIARDMLDTMRFAKGIGLAGTQVGINKRIIVIDRLDANAEPIILINPRILQKKGKTKFCEGCLSVPNITSDVVRPEWILVEALDLRRETVRIDTGGLLARVIQHEIDHLDGILFIDRIGFLKRKKIVKELDKKVCIEF